MFLSLLGTSIVFPLRLLYLGIVFQQPLVQGLLADASPVAARGRVQGVAGAAGAVGGSLAAFASLPLYHETRTLPFFLAAAVMALGAVVAAVGALAFARRRRYTVEIASLAAR